MTQVDLIGVAKRFGGVTAVDGIDLSVPSGCLAALLGPSGCGKTTILRLIAGLERPDAGAIRFDGTDVAARPPQDRNVGLVFQSYALFPHMRVRDNVAFGLSVRGMDRDAIRARVDTMLATVHLTAQADRFPAQLSGGQRQRVALARTLVTEPGVLMLDEPLANLDTGLRAEMRAFIRDLQRRLGLTTIFVTHDQAEALEMANRVAVVLDGRVAQWDTAQGLYRRPAGAAVAAFMGAENVLPARIDGTIAQTDAGPISVPPGTAPGPARIMLRAEAIDMAPGEGAGDGPGLAGIVAACDFTGAMARYRVDVGAAHIHVTQPARQLLDPGTPVRLSIDATDVWVLPEED